MNIEKPHVFEPMASSEPDRTDQSPLAAALLRASSRDTGRTDTGRVEVTDDIPIAAEPHGLEDSLADAMQQELGPMPEFGPKPKPEPKKRDVEPAKPFGDLPPIETVKQSSPRTLELQRKRSAAEKMRRKLQDGSELLTDLMRSSDALVSYLATAEQQFTHLEAVEEQSTRTQAKADELLIKYKKLTDRSKEQQKQIEILELTKARNRKAIDTAKTEIERLKQTVKVMQHDSSTKEMAVVKLEDEITKLRDVHEVVQAENDERGKKLDARDMRIDDLTREVSAQKAELLQTRETTKVLGKEKEQATIGFNDMVVRYKNLNDKLADLKSQLDEKIYELESKAKAFEESNSIKDARIHELETELIEAKRQLINSDSSVDPYRGQQMSIADPNDPVPAAVRRPPLDPKERAALKNPDAG